MENIIPYIIILISTIFVAIFGFRAKILDAVSKKYPAVNKIPFDKLEKTASDKLNEEIKKKLMGE